jgi:predicted transcriptional regulator
MKKQTETPLYATLLYEVRKKLDITWIEYVYLDMVYHLSKDGWCYKSLDNCGADLGLDRSNVYRMRKRLIAKGLIKKSVNGYVKTTVMYANCIRSDDKTVAKRTEPYAKRDSAVVKTHTKINLENYKEKGSSSTLGEKGTYSPAKERIREMFKNRAQHGTH